MKLKDLLSENFWNQAMQMKGWEAPPKEKRWSKQWNGNSNKSGLTAFERRTGGKDFVKEVGAAADFHKVNKQIEKSYRQYWDGVKDLEKILIKKGLKSKAFEIHKQFAKGVLGFQAWLRGQVDRLL